MDTNIAIAKGLEVWTIISSYNLALLLLLIGLFLHLSSSFMSNSLRNFRIIVSKENWTILLLFIRDISLFASFGISLLLINPDMFADVKLPMPFFPLGTVFLGIALIYKIKGLQGSPKRTKIFFIFLVTAALIQYIGFILVMEAAPTEWVYAGIAPDYWLWFRNLRSNLNPHLAMLSFYISFPFLIIILVIITWEGVKSAIINSIIHGGKETEKL